MASVHELYSLEQIPSKNDVNEKDLFATCTLTDKDGKADIAKCCEMLKKRHEYCMGKVLGRIATQLTDFHHEFSDRIDHQLFPSQHHGQYFESVPGDAFLRKHRKSFAQKIEQTQKIIASNTPDVAPKTHVPQNEEQPPSPYKASLQALYDEEYDSLLLEKLKIIEEAEFAYMDDLMHISSDPVHMPPSPAPSTSAQRPIASRDPRLGQGTMPPPSGDPSRRRQ
ncbi:hypothetical protein BX666DRAFT_2026407 [Dichotomocladium elegans]|nr:hypothetical protein BX666DRAFT_2026407 [Dichotomocladium elegans]